jgi:hypothetical protein
MAKVEECELCKWLKGTYDKIEKINYTKFPIRYYNEEALPFEITVACGFTNNNLTMNGMSCGGFKEEEKVKVSL